MATSSKTLHRIRPGYLKKCVRSRAGGDVYSPARNSLSQCLISIPNDAVMRLRIKLADHRTFTRFAERGGRGSSQEEVIVQARVAGSSKRVADEFCWRIMIWARRVFVISPESGWSPLYDSIKNTLVITESRPAYKRSAFSGMYH